MKTYKEYLLGLIEGSMGIERIIRKKQGLDKESNKAKLKSNMARFSYKLKKGEKKRAAK